LFTRDNHFIDNVIFRPTGFPTGGDYFAKTSPGTQKGPTFFWANRGYGAGQTSNSDFFDNAEWLDFVPDIGGVNDSVKGLDVLEDLGQHFNDTWIDVVDQTFTEADEFTAADLRDQPGWGGQAGTLVDPVSPQVNQNSTSVTESVSKLSIN